ncbi:MAG: folylpolyglutamate synthase/dihydrofolate synthase family protein [Desulfuromonadales bacterium]|nr:folylpolyglutamate synthase/dihydrofolate synthase family protein [Desulfuromonadales bacterium]
MDFPESLDYLYGLQRFGVKLGLKNMQDLKTRLPLLQEHLPCIHVAGTNGKGSVSVLLAEMLRHSGLRTGLYTSPHLHCFTERIRIDGVPLARNEMTLHAESIRQAAGDLPITFFEATTAIALLAFKEHQVEIAVIETGLGGRLDATNTIDPQLCLITPISMDHSEHLGENLAAIAAEKAGIIKPGIPVVVGRQSQTALEVILSAAGRHNAAVCLAGRDFRWQGDHDNLSVAVGDSSIDGLTCVLAGEHQLDNLAQAVAGAMQLRKQGIAIPDAAIHMAGATVVWPGRLEWFGDSRQVLLDVSHNLAGITCLANYLAEQKVSRIHLVTGLSGKRDPAEVLMPLVKYVAAVYAVPVSHETSVPTRQVTAWAEQQSVPVFEYMTADQGLAAALKSAGPNEPVVVCGSLYLVAELRHALLEEDIAAGDGAAGFF